MNHLLCLLFLAYLSSASAIAYFTPPSGWEGAQPKHLSPHVHVGFLGKGKSDFRPSINFASEEVDVSLKDYVKAVKELHKADPNMKWRDLGKFVSKAGEGRLAEIGTTSPWGDVRLLQLIVVKDKMAYILTGSALKSESIELQSELLQAFQSLTVAADLFESLEPAKKQLFSRLLSQLKGAEPESAAWKELQTALKGCPEMGDYWPLLVLNEARKQTTGQN
jgi:hypothetical protein